MYGFRKVQKLNSGALKTAYRDDGLEFRHECAAVYGRTALTPTDFQRDRPELMVKITRKKAAAGGDEAHGTSGGGANDAQVQNLLSRLEAVTERQDALAREFQTLAGANQALWDEQRAVQAKYDQQQQTIQTIISFLASQFNGQIQVDTKTGRELPANNALERMTAMANLANAGAAAGPSRARPDSTARRRLPPSLDEPESRLEEVADRSAFTPPSVPTRRAIEAKPELSRSASPFVSDAEARFSLLPDSPPTVNEHAFSSSRPGSAGNGAFDALTGLDPPLSDALRGAYTPANGGAFGEFDASRPLDPNAGALVPYDQGGRGLEHVRADMAHTAQSIEEIMAEIDALGGGSGIGGALGQSGNGSWDLSDFLSNAADQGTSAVEAPVAGPSRKRKSSGASETAGAAKRGRA